MSYGRKVQPAIVEKNTCESMVRSTSPLSLSLSISPPLFLDHNSFLLMSSSLLSFMLLRCGVLQQVKIRHQHQRQLEDPTTTYHHLITLQELAESHLLPSFSTFTKNPALMNISFPRNSIPEPRRLAQISLGARVPCLALYVTIAIAALLSSSRSLHKQGSCKIPQFRSQLP